MDLSRDRLRNERIQSISYMLPRILVQRTAVTNRLSLAVFKEIIGNTPFGSQTRFTSNKHVVHCPSKFCWQKENTMCDACFQTVFSARGIAGYTHFTLQRKYRMGTFLANLKATTPYLSLHHTHTTLHYTTQLG